MRQITKFDELPEDVKATWSSVYTSGMDSMVASYNAGLRDGGERPPLTEVPERCTKVFNESEYMTGAYGRQSDALLAVLNAFIAGEQPAETPAPAAETASVTGLAAELDAMSAYDEIEDQIGTDDEFAAAEKPLLAMVKQPTVWTAETVALHESLICLIATLRKRGNS